MRQRPARGQAPSLRKTGRTFGPPAYPEIRGQREHQARRAIERHIAPGAGARWHEALVPFIHGSDKNGPQPRQQSGAPQPAMIVIERCPPTTQHKKTQHAVADYVPSLAQVMMKDEEVVEIDLAE